MASANILVPEDAADVIRKTLALKRPPRISYLPGPGDLKGTYRYWLAGQHDPNIPSITYSAMFFDLCQDLEAQAQIIVRGMPLPEDETIGNFRFDGVSHEISGDRLEWLNGSGDYADQCIEKVNSFDPDIIIVSMDFPVKHLPRLGKGRHVILTMHNTLWPMGQKQFDLSAGLTGGLKVGLKIGVKKALLSRYLAKIDAAICTSGECANQLTKVIAGDVPTFVSVPQQHITIKEKQLSAIEHNKRLIFLGRIEINKGVFDLLDAFEKIYKTHDDLTLEYVGSGPALDALQQEVTRRGLERKVFLRGRVPASEIHNFLSNAYALVCPTRLDFFEGLAFVCFEAAIHGVPSILTEVVPARDLLGDSCIVVPPNNPEKLAQALDQLVNDPSYQLSLARKAREAGQVTYDRSQSWGSNVYKAIAAIRN